MINWVARAIQQRNVGLRIPNPIHRLTQSFLRRVPRGLFTALAVIVVLAVLVGLGAADGIERRPIHIWSDGTRMAGDLWLPAGFGEGSDAPRFSSPMAGAARATTSTAPMRQNSPTPASWY